MNKLTPTDVKKVADLVKIKLAPGEIESYLSQLNVVLPSVEILKELNTENVQETSQTHGLKNVFRTDESLPGLDIKKYPNKKNLKNDYFVVNRVIK